MREVNTNASNGRQEVTAERTTNFREIEEIKMTNSEVQRVICIMNTILEQKRIKKLIKGHRKLLKAIGKL